MITLLLEALRGGKVRAAQRAAQLGLAHLQHGLGALRIRACMLLLEKQQRARREAADHRDQRHRTAHHEGQMPLRELFHHVSPRALAGQHRLVMQMTPHIVREGRRARIAAGGVHLQRLQRDRIEITPLRLRQQQRTWQHGRRGDVFGHRPLPRFFIRLPLHLQRRAAGDQFIKHHAQRIQIAAHIHVLHAPGALLRAHVARSAHGLMNGGHRARVIRVRRGLQRLCDAEIDDLHRALVAAAAHEDVRGLQIAMQHTFFMRVLHRLADRAEKIEPLLQPQLQSLAKHRHWLATHQLHREERLSVHRHAAVP